MPKITVGKWGNNLAVRLPKEIANAVGLIEGSAVEIEARSRDIRHPAGGSKFHPG